MVLDLNLPIHVPHVIMGLVLLVLPTWTVFGSIINVILCGTLLLRAFHASLGFKEVSWFFWFVGLCLLSLRVITCMCMDAEDEDEAKDDNKKGDDKKKE